MNLHFVTIRKLVIFCYNYLMFYFENIDGKRILKSDFIKDAEAFFTTRDLCICDKGVNNNPSTQTRNESIHNNRKIICNYLKIDEKNFIFPEQTHSANIDIAIETRNNYPDCDALILTEKNLGIFLNFADCTPIILYDKVQKIGAIAHAGWRGTAQKIAPLTAQKLVEKFGSKIENIVAIIGPAIGFCCYNVGQDVYEKLSQTVNNFEGLFEIRNGEIFVDLKGINQRQLEELGIEKIDVCPYCTVHNNDLFYSYRNENGTGKRHSAVLRL